MELLFNLFEDQMWLKSIHICADRHSHNTASAAMRNPVIYIPLITFSAYSNYHEEASHTSENSHTKTLQQDRANIYIYIYRKLTLWWAWRFEWQSLEVPTCLCMYGHDTDLRMLANHPSQDKLANTAVTAGVKREQHMHHFREIPFLFFAKQISFSLSTHVGLNCHKRE